MSVRSAVLARGVVFAGDTPLIGTVPDGETWIVKSAEVSPVGVGSSSVQLYAEAADASTRATFFQQTVPSLSPVHYSGWVVMLPGDNLFAHSSAVDEYYWVSGARLVGVAP